MIQVFRLMSMINRQWINKVECTNITQINEMLFYTKTRLNIYQNLRKCLKNGGQKKAKKKLSLFLKKELACSSRRFLAVDGSEIQLPHNFTEYGYRKSTNGYCASAYISGLFDVNTKIPINFKLFLDKNERNVALEQMKVHMKKGDVIIGDRGYYSENFVSELKKYGCDFILRIRSNLYLAKPLLKKLYGSYNTVIRHENEQIYVRIIKYTIPDKNGNYFISVHLFHTPNIIMVLLKICMV